MLHIDHLACSYKLDRRQAMLLGLAALLTACRHDNDGDDRAAPCPPGRDALKDKFRGMLLLGAYGDALGANHEYPDGLAGRIADPSGLTRLPPFGESSRESPDPWGIWPNPADIPDDKRGMITDDTSYRVAILHAWLCDRRDRPDPPTEAEFKRWLKEFPKPGEDAPQWQQSRYRQVRAWICMMEDAERLKVDRDGFEQRPCMVDGTEVQTFFRKDVSVVTGAFLYTELAAIYACCPPAEVFRKLEDFSCLDQGYGRTFTGMLGALMADALCQITKNPAFDVWFCQAAGEHLEAPESGENQDRRTLRTAFQAAKRFGEDNRALGEKDFLEKLKSEIYDPHVTPESGGTRSGFENFDPLLFLKQMAAALGYAQGDLVKALRVLAAGPGDADTVPSFLGSIMGGWCGETALRGISDALAEDLTRIETCINELYGIRLNDICNCLVELAEKHGCCKSAEGG